jgi:hypothetical protein
MIKELGGKVPYTLFEFAGNMNDSFHTRVTVQYYYQKVLLSDAIALAFDLDDRIFRLAETLLAQSLDYQRQLDKRE